MDTNTIILSLLVVISALMLIIIIMSLRQRRFIQQKFANQEKDMLDSLLDMQDRFQKDLSRSRTETGALLSDSFGLVAENLERVNKGLGEMRSLAMDARDLKKALVNVKVKGNLGEVMLKNLLDDCVPGRYVENFRPFDDDKKVEFAIKLPGRSGEELYLPLDSKFPSERYNELLNAADVAEEKKARSALRSYIMGAAREIRKYLNPPRTTDFALMFLPTEGLYAEVLRDYDLFEEVRKRHGIIMVGPSTLSVILTSLMVGFRNFAIEEKSREILDSFTMIKNEFDAFSAKFKGIRKDIVSLDKSVGELELDNIKKIDRALEAATSIKEAEKPSGQNDFTDAYE